VNHQCVLYIMYDSPYYPLHNVTLHYTVTSVTYYRITDDETS